MVNISMSVGALEMFQRLLIQTSELLPENTAQIHETFKSYLETITFSNYGTLFVIFLLLYVLFSIVSMIVRWLLGTVVGMIKFGIYIAMAIGLYWLYVSIDVEKGNEELRVASEKLVKGAQEFVHRDL
ncbi:hypothetical protein RclHR1_02900003 [Rhizophagus clarus]|uniref:Uncharacterized protein n=1 Tax=Rhizophagus clarus TaxID=94130 RepID=A0A2Z6R4P5_9GLOM|nr:hypothetical protein RclHR1_02900003 [Rhizophagus clarus]GES81357.1 hypothetical protein GLOIN_2v1718356 [Rhizophagus clarus]